MQSQLPSAPASIGGILDGAFRLYRGSYSRCWPAVLISAVASVAYGILYVLSLPPAPPAANLLQGLVSLAERMEAHQSPLVVGVRVLFWVTVVVCYGAVIVMESAVGRGEPPVSLGKALGVGLRRLPAAVLIWILTILMAFVGLILFVIPGIYVLGKLQLAYVALFADGDGPLQALKTSWRLTRRRWWRGMFIVGVAVIFTYVVILGFSLLTGFVTAFVHPNFTEGVVLLQLITAVSNVVVLPLTFAILVAMYHDFKLRSTGGDLAARVGALGTPA